MPKRKANWWPPSILSDPDVLSMDDEGRFVLCKICHVHYAVHGGKKPKPVIMNSNFRTRAWDVHKERTNSHRLQKQQERLQQAKAQAQQQQTTDTQQQQQQGQAKQPGKEQQDQQNKPSQTQAQTQEQSQSVPALATQIQTLTQVPPRQVQGQVQQALAPPTHQQPPPQVSLQSHSGVQGQEQLQQQQQQQQQKQLEETKDAGQGRLQVDARNSAAKRPASASPETITAVTMAGANSLHHGGMISGGKRPETTMPMGTPNQRRRVFRAGSPGSSRQLIAESGVARHAASHTLEKHSLVTVGVANQKTPASNENAMAMEQQADSSARWRHMHDDVSRALNAAPRRRQPGPTSYTSGELRAAKTLVQTETGDLGSNNSERVAKKLRSLNAEFHASNMRHGDAYNIRHTDVFDRRSAGYKEYWGTLRDVYTSSGSGGSGNPTPIRKTHHPRNPLVRPIQEESKETEADFTTPDDSGSSEDAFKPAVVVHDASLISAIERLTDATSNHIASLYQKEASSTREALAGLTSVMTDMRVQQGNAFERMIELQQKHLKVMESILEIKLRKEAARNARNSDENSSGGSRGDSSNGGDSASGQGAENALQSQSG